MKTFTWHIVDVAVVDGSPTFPQRIDSAQWVLVCSQDGQNETVTGETVLFPPDSLSFSAYADVTEADVVGWVKHRLGTSAVAAAEKLAAAKLDLALGAAPSAAGMPWGA